MNKLKNIRIGDIEARVSGTDDAYEIVKWYPNDLYNKQDDYIYISEIDKYTKEYASNCYYDPACFLSKENCYVLCWITDSDEPDVHTVGMRPFDLEEDDNSDFMLVLRVAVKNVAKSYSD